MVGTGITSGCGVDLVYSEDPDAGAYRGPNVATPAAVPSDAADDEVREVGGTKVDASVEPTDGGGSEAGADTGGDVVLPTATPDAALDVSDAEVFEASADAAVDAAVEAGVPPGPVFVYQHFDINHVLSTGQSNAVTNGGTPVLSNTQPFGNLSFNTGVMPMSSCNGNVCRVYQTPSGFKPLVEGDQFFGYGVETLSSGMANQITQLAMDRYLPAGPRHDVLVTLHGRSGNAYPCLRKGGCAWFNEPQLRPFDQAMMEVKDAKALAAALGKTYVVRAVTVIHGESDHYSPGNFPLNGTDGAPNALKNYADGLMEWQRDYEAGVKAITGQSEAVPLFLVQMHGWVGDASTNKSVIPANQLDAHVRAPGKVVLVAPEYPVEFKYQDSIHLSNAAGRRLGEYFAKAYASVVMAGKAWEPLRPAEIVRNGPVIDVTFVVPVPPLVLDVVNVTNPGNYGFNFTDNSGATPAIASVVLTGASSVRVTLAQAPSDTAVKYLSYAHIRNTGPTRGGPTTGARGNLRDSDATPTRYAAYPAQGDSPPTPNLPLYNWGVTFNQLLP